jgi:hypothetical protein
MIRVIIIQSATKSIDIISVAKRIIAPTITQIVMMISVDIVAFETIEYEFYEW